MPEEGTYFILRGPCPARASSPPTGGGVCVEKEGEEGGREMRIGRKVVFARVENIGGRSPCRGDVWKRAGEGNRGCDQDDTDAFFEDWPALS